MGGDPDDLPDPAHGRAEWRGDHALFLRGRPSAGAEERPGRGKVKMRRALRELSRLRRLLGTVRLTRARLRQFPALEHQVWALQHHVSELRQEMAELRRQMVAQDECNRTAGMEFRALHKQNDTLLSIRDVPPELAAEFHD